MHLDCVLWVPGVMMVGAGLVGLEAGLQECRSRQCGKCRLAGPSIHCMARHCSQAVHFPCAEPAGWQLLSDTLWAYCASHKQQCGK